MSNLAIELNDGSRREVMMGTTLREFVSQVSPRLLKTTIAGRLNKNIIGLSDVLLESGKLSLLDFANEDAKRVYWHTASHILAQALKRLYPNVKLGIGPATDRGFYYDFELDEPIKAEKLAEIEAQMNLIIKENLEIQKEVLSKKEGYELFVKRTEPLKLELIESLSDSEDIRIYNQGEFVDLCKGPHLRSTGEVKAVKLMSLTGAYWKGDEKRQMLQRIYGIAFPKRSLLEAYIEKLEEAKKRDHNKLGRELELFTTADIIGQGLPLFLPKGAKMLQILQRFVEDEEQKRGYLLTKTPIMAKSDLYKISGHWDLYRDGMFVMPAGDSEEDVLALRPMTCPFQYMVYKASPKSYRDLPLRYAETSTLFRNESSGEMHGIIRVRQFTISEGHLLLTEAQLQEEFKGVLSLVNYMMETLGIIEDVSYQFSKCDPQNPDKYLGTVEQWDEVQGKMKDILELLKIDFTEAEGEAAFYGPKLDIQFRNVHGKEDTIITIQVDFNLAERFDLTYMDSDGEKKRPVIIHRTSIGCYERTLAMLIEKYAGKFPLWLAPVQIKVLTLSDRILPYAEAIVKALENRGLRAEIDGRAEKIGYKIREAQLEHIPYMLVIGDKDEAAKAVSVRSRDLGDLGSMSLEQVMHALLEENASKRLKSIF